MRAGAVVVLGTSIGSATRYAELLSASQIPREQINQPHTTILEGIGTVCVKL